MIDERGRIHGYRRAVQYSSASLVKAMLLVAYLRRGDVKRRRLRGSERGLLGPMIRISDNDAATAIYGRVGASGLSRLARRAGMRRFVPNPVWGGSQVTAGDQARFFFRIRGLVPKRHRSYALGLLRRVVPAQRWGIPRSKPAGWRIHFKGGWVPDDDGWRVHQAALLRQGHRKLAIAVLARSSPASDTARTRSPASPPGCSAAIAPPMAKAPRRAAPGPGRLRTGRFPPTDGGNRLCTDDQATREGWRWGFLDFFRGQRGEPIPTGSDVPAGSTNSWDAVTGGDAAADPGA